MSTSNISKIYKFKLADLTVTVTVDNSYFGEATKPFDGIPVEWLHYHALHELFFVVGAPIVINTDSKKREYADSVVCVPPFLKHKTERNGDCRILFSYTKNADTGTDFSRFMDAFCAHDDIVSYRIDSGMEIYIKELGELFEASSDLADEMAVSLLKMIFYSIYRVNAKIKPYTAKSTNDSYLVKIDRILASYGDDITLSSVADRLGLSTRQTSRIIMKHYKSSLSDLLTQQRLEVAKRLLLNSEMTVSEIVEHVNFPSESYFYVRFKKAFGMTPMKYKASQKCMSVSKSKD